MRAKWRSISPDTHQGLVITFNIGTIILFIRYEWSIDDTSVSNGLQHGLTVRRFSVKALRLILRLVRYPVRIVCSTSVFFGAKQHIISLCFYRWNLDKKRIHVVQTFIIWLKQKVKKVFIAWSLPIAVYFSNWDKNKQRGIRYRKKEVSLTLKK